MRFLYVHFPKAGGSSLRTQLEQQFPGRVLADYAHDPIGGTDPRTEARPSDEIKCVLGHLHASRYASWADRMFTILRDPVQNLVSIYFFWRSLPTIGNRMHDRFLHERPSLPEFAKSYPLKFLMTKSYFGDFDMNRFDFVGFHENRRAAFSKLRELTGKPLSHEVHVNRTDRMFDEERARIAENAAIMGALRHELREDVQFYAAMRRKWA